MPHLPMLRGTSFRHGVHSRKFSTMIPANSSNGRDSVARRIYGLNETLFCIRTTEIGTLKKKLGNRKGNLPKRAILKVIMESVLISKDESH